ncbi:MAG: Rid family detoxifying hydrolase [Parachlamydiales bacterium]
MTKKGVDTPKAPKAIGPYSQAIAINAPHLLMVSGQIPVDPSTGELVKDDIKSATRRVLSNIKAILNEAGTDFEHVVKVQIFVIDMDDFQAVNSVYAEFFDKQPYPARETVEVSRLPLGACIEISCIAAIP